MTMLHFDDLPITWTAMAGSTTARPSGVLSTSVTMSPRDFDALRAAWAGAFNGGVKADATTFDRYRRDLYGSRRSDYFMVCNYGLLLSVIALLLLVVSQWVTA